MITDGDEQNPLNFGSNFGDILNIETFLSSIPIYPLFLSSSTDATEPSRGYSTSNSLHLLSTDATEPNTFPYIRYPASKRETILILSFFYFS
jgi:hypothetical protein